MINWRLSKRGIRWPVTRDLIACSSLQLIQVACFFRVFFLCAGISIGYAGSCQVNLLKKGRIVWEPVNWIITFSYIRMLFCCFVLLIWSATLPSSSDGGGGFDGLCSSRHSCTHFLCKINYTYGITFIAFMNHPDSRMTHFADTVSVSNSIVSNIPYGMDCPQTIP